MLKFILAAGMLLASCAQTATCVNEHGHSPDDHHPACEAPKGHSAGPSIILPPEPEIEPSGHPNNGFGNGNQNAPGNSEKHNNAENAGGNN